jgi:kynurenine formamidase
VIVQLSIQGTAYHCTLSAGFDLSLPVHSEGGGIRAFGLGPVQMTPFQAGSFIGNVAAGGSANCDLLSFYPHGNGTHTESMGHIMREPLSVHRALKQFFFRALLISVEPEQRGEDRVITAAQIRKALQNHPGVEALIIRTLPNDAGKRTRDYTGTNPAWFEAEALAAAAAAGVKHWLCDVPSVDREDDGGLLLAHHAWWHYPEAPRTDATITELIYVPDEAADGLYLLNLQVAPIESDAAPSRPLIFPLHPAP